MLLQELFKKDDQDFKITKSATRWQAKYKTKNGNDLRVFANKVRGMEVWSFAFMINDSTELTGSGNEIEVFNAVLNALKMFVAEVKPKQIVMSSDQPNRTSLYKKMLARILKGWKVISFHDDENDFDVIAAVEGNEFPVVKTKEGYGVSILPGMLLGFKKDGKKTATLDSASKLGSQLEAELEKAQAQAA